MPKGYQVVEDDTLFEMNRKYILGDKGPEYYSAIEDLIDHHNARYDEIREYQQYLARIDAAGMVPKKKFSEGTKRWMKFKLLLNFWR